MPSSTQIHRNGNFLRLLGLSQPTPRPRPRPARPRLGSSGQNSVQAGAFWGGYFLEEYLFLEKNIPDLDFLGLSNAKNHETTLKNHGNQPKTMKLP